MLLLKFDSFFKADFYLYAPPLNFDFWQEIYESKASDWSKGLPDINAGF